MDSKIVQVEKPAADGKQRARVSEAVSATEASRS